MTSYWKKLSGVTMAALLMAGLAAGCGGGEKKSAGSDKEYVVGVNAELTGNVANYGKSMKSGFELAVDEVNKAGGINGKKVRIVEADNKSEPSESGNAATKLVTQDKVIAVVGPANLRRGRRFGTDPDGRQGALDCPVRDGSGNHRRQGRQDETVRVPRRLHRPLPGRNHGEIRQRRQEIQEGRYPA